MIRFISLLILSSILVLPFNAFTAVTPQLAAGVSHSVALLADGTVATWGLNDSGQLGDGSTNPNSNFPTGIGLSNVKSVAAGGYHTVALMADGTVMAWGLNDSGQLGDGTTTNSNVPVTVSGLGGPVTAIAAGAYHTLALMADGTVKAWGFNGNGQLGQDSTTLFSSSIPLTVAGLDGSGSPVTAIVSGSYHGLALMTDGSVMAWGANDSGQLGDGTNTDSYTPVSVISLSSSATALSAGDSHSVALLANGTLQAWGINDLGQLGNNSTIGSNSPVTVSTLGGTVTAIGAGSAHTIALIADGTVQGWGANDAGQLGNGTFTGSIVPTEVSQLGGTVKAIAVGSAHTLGILADGSIKGWGFNGNGELGIGNFLINSNVPATAVGLSGAVVALSARCSHTVALMFDGTVTAWGENGSGQLGDGTTIDSSSPVTVPGLSGVKAIAAGCYHTLALMENGSVMTWGANGNGQLGDGTIIDSSSPVTVPGLSGVTAIAAGDSFSLALIGGNIKSWGSNSFGQLGDGTTIDSSSPLNFSGLSNVTAITAGFDYTVALLADGSVKALGHNNYGQLGDGTTNDNLSPVSVTGLGPVTAIAAGDMHVVVLQADGSVKTWGANDSGQLGNGTITNSSIPVTITGITAATAIAAGGEHSLAIAGGGVKSWGSNRRGQLGNGSFNDSSIPVNVTGITAATAITAGGSHSATILTGGEISSWGSNSFGQLGNNGFFTSIPQSGYINLDNVQPAVVADKPEGPYLGSVTVTLSCSDNFSGCNSIHYTDNGDTPSLDSPLYSGSLTITVNENLQFIAADNAGNLSNPQSIAYTVLPETYPLTVTISGNGSVTGVTTGTPLNLSYNSSGSTSITTNATVDLTANPGPGYTFIGWSEVCTGTGPCSVTMDQIRSVTATFTDTTPPDVTIGTKPSAQSSSATGTFSFSSTDVSASFECKMDSGNFAPCTSPYITAPLTDGSHTFSVQGKDPAGNITPVPADYSWNIVTITPSVKNGSNSYTSLAAALLAASSGDTLKLLANMTPEALNYTGSGLLKLDGGYDAGWIKQPDMFSRVSSLIVTSGTLVINQLIIRQ